MKSRWRMLLVAAISCSSGLTSSVYGGEILMQGIPGRSSPQLIDLNQQVQAGATSTNLKSRAAELRKLGLPDQAVNDLNKAMELEPQDAVAPLVKAEVYFESGMYPEALKACDESLKVDPKFVGAMVLKTRCFQKLKDYSKALDQANALFPLAQNSPEPYLLRGAALERLGKYDDAIKDLSTAITQDPNQAKAYYYRGEAYQDSGQYEKSLPDYTKAIELEPSFRPAMISRAWTNYKMKKDADALSDASRAIRFTDADMLRAVNKYVGEKSTIADITPDPEYNLGMHIEEDLKNAIVLFNDVLKDKPGDPDALRDRGIALMHLGKYKDGLKDFEAANKDLNLPVNPKDFPGFGKQADYDAAKVDYQAGNDDLNNGNFQSSLDHYRQAISKYPTYAKAWHNMAIDCGGMGDYFSAEICCIHSISYRPDDWKLWNTFGYTLFHEYQHDKGDPQKLNAAAAALEQALALKPDSPDDKADIKKLLSNVKAYERSLAPTSNFVITTMPLI